MKRTRKKQKGVDKKCEYCPEIMTDIHPNTKACPKCAKKRLRDQNNIATAKYKRRNNLIKSDNYVDDSLTPEVLAKRASFARWNAERKAKESANS